MYVSIVPGTTLTLKGERSPVKVVELLGSRAPAWERSVGGRDVYLDREFTQENLDRWLGDVLVDVGGGVTRAVEWREIDMTSVVVPAPVVQVQAVPAAMKPRIVLPPPPSGKPVTTALPKTKPLVLTLPKHKPN